MINMHATAIEYKSKGIMIVGESGSGKSDLALRMVLQKKAKLIADDRVEIDIKNGFVKNLTKNIQIQITPLPEVMIKLLNEGGLIEHIKKHGDFDLV